MKIVSEITFHAINDSSVKWCSFFLAIAATVALCMFAYWNNHGYFLHDDFQHQYLPMFYEIGRQLRDGNFPFITLRSWFQGNIVGEYQYAIFNPFSLAMYAAIADMENLQLAAALFTGAHMLVAAAGGYWLAREFRIKPILCTTAGFTIATNTFALYWLGSSWVPGYVSYAWFLPAVAALLAYSRRGVPILIPVFFAYQVFSAGWPQSVVALGLAYGAWVVLPVSFGKENFKSWWQEAVRQMLPLLMALAAAMVALVPLVVYAGNTLRTSGLFTNGGLVGTLEGVLTTFIPFSYTFFGFGIGTVAEIPFYYSAWFVVVLPALILKSDKLKSFGIEWKYGLCLTIIFALLAIGPEQMGSMRYPFRFVPFFSVFLICISLVAIDFVNSRLLLVVAVVIGLGGYISWSGSTSGSSLVSALFILAAVICTYNLKNDYRPIFVFSVSFLVTFSIQFFHPVNSHFNSKGLPESLTDAVMANGVDSSRGTTLHLIRNINVLSSDMKPAGMSDLISGGMSLMRRDSENINGYSPMRPKGLGEFYCLNLFGWACTDIFSRIFKLEKTTQITHADLQRLDRILVQKGIYSRKFNAIFPKSEWRLVLENENAFVYERIKPLPTLPGKLTWISPGVEVVQADIWRTDNERYRVNTRVYSGMMVFSRAWFPGYRAYLNGQELPVFALNDIYVAVRLPDNAAGDFLLEYRPPGWAWTVPLALLAWLAVMVISLGAVVGGFGGRARALLRKA